MKNSNLGAQLRPVALAVAALAAFAGAGGAHAQEAGASKAPEAERTTLEAVVVTVQRRKEKLQEVPVAATAITAADLETRNISNVSNIGSVAPNLQVSSTPGNATAVQLSIRGSVTINPALSFEPTVGMYVDGVYFGKTQGSVFDLVDLERIEVLRGPQGTLYGRNTLAGAINLVTKKPSGDLSGAASLEVGNYDARVGKFSLDLPALGPLKLSVGGRVEKRDGWIKTTPGSAADSQNDRDSSAGRIAATLDLSKDLSFDYRYDTNRVRQNGQFSQIVRSDVDAMFGFKSGIVLSPDDRMKTASINDPSYENLDIDGHALTAEWRFNENNTLKYIGAHREMKWGSGMDLDGSPVSFAATQRISDYEQTSHELQLIGGSGKLNYVAGVYKFSDDGFTSNPQTFFFGASNFDSRMGFTTEASSIYGQADYKLTDDLTLTAGLRRTEEDKTTDRYNAMVDAKGALMMVLIPQGTAAKTSFSSTTPLLSLGYKISDQVSVYGRYSEGFKSGGFNGESSTVAESLLPYRPEKLKSYELGVKSTLAGGRVMLNAALFDNESTDLQQTLFTATGAAASDIRNIGKANSRGLELEAAWRVNADLRLQGSYGYLRTKYKEFPNDKGENIAWNVAPVHAPRHSLNLMADATLAHTAWGRVRGMVDYSFTGGHYLYPYQIVTLNPSQATASNTFVRSNGLVNLRLVLSDIDIGAGNAEVAFWVRNAGDRKHIGNKIDFGPGFGNLTQAYYIDPRTVGVTLTARW